MSLFADIAGGATAAANSALSSLTSGLLGSIGGGMGVSSAWDGLNPNLIASIGPCDHHGAPNLAETPIQCLFVDDANLDFQLAWQSPFEGSGPETKAPTFVAMLQSGELQPLLERAPDSGATSAVSNLAEMARGKSGVTKLNSTQVFASMPPARLQTTILLRAWADPQSEVEAPLNKLMGWALPELAAEGTLLTAIIDILKTDNLTAESAIDKLLPSKAPSLISIAYKGRRFAPMVIETVGIPLNAPSDEHGRFVQLQIPVTFATLRAFDKGDWAASTGAGAGAGGLANDAIGLVTDAVSGAFF